MPMCAARNVLKQKTYVSKNLIFIQHCIMAAYEVTVSDSCILSELTVVVM